MPARNERVPTEDLLRELDAALARWEVPVDKHGRIRTEDLRRAVRDGRIRPTPGSPTWLWFSDL